MSRVVAVVLVALLVVGSAGAGATDGAARSAASLTALGATAPAPPAPVVYAAPVSPLRVVRAFDPPTTPYGPGHLGVDLATVPGQVVRSAADGVVRFAGRVAGRGVVVVLHADGIATEYEPVSAAVRAGALVRRGQSLGVVEGTHRPCASGRCLHWGARRGATYLDPMDLLHPLGPVRLVPW